jgi:hypothetical protein
MLGGTAQAAEKVEAALYWGHNTPPSLLSRRASPELRERLREVFGFRYYQLLKADKIMFRRSPTNRN